MPLTKGETVVLGLAGIDISHYGIAFAWNTGKLAGGVRNVLPAACCHESSMKITVLTYLDKENAKVLAVTAEQVASALREGGHKVSLFGIHGDLRKLISGL